MEKVPKRHYRLLHWTFPPASFAPPYCQPLVHPLDQFLDPGIDHLSVFVGRAVDLVVTQDALQVLNGVELLAAPTISKC